MQVHLVDGTYELFRSYFGAPEAKAEDGREVGATRGLARSLLRLVTGDGATHVAVAFDHVVESFRNDLFDGYKTGEGIEPELWEQFELAEQITHALGLVVWPMVEFEADDALAAGAALYAKDPRVERVLICTPDKDLAQCVRDTHVVCWDRRREKILDHAGVWEKFGVGPASIPDWLALVGDDADGIPGVPRWGRKSASTALAACTTVENIPEDPQQWEFQLRGAAGLAASLNEHREQARLYRRLATLREDVPLTETLDDLHWQGARRDELQRMTTYLQDDALMQRIPRWRDAGD